MLIFGLQDLVFVGCGQLVLRRLDVVAVGLFVCLALVLSWRLWLACCMIRGLHVLFGAVVCIVFGLCCFR